MNFNHIISRTTQSAQVKKFVPIITLCSISITISRLKSRLSGPIMVSERSVII
jgi:hypothetical protein